MWPRPLSAHHIQHPAKVPDNMALWKVPMDTRLVGVLGSWRGLLKTFLLPAKYRKTRTQGLFWEHLKAHTCIAACGHCWAGFTGSWQLSIKHSEDRCWKKGTQDHTTDTSNRTSWSAGEDQSRKGWHAWQKYATPKRDFQHWTYPTSAPTGSCRRTQQHTPEFTGPKSYQ